MNHSQIKYKIYPSLLDKFQNYLDSEIEFESFWNQDNETGEYKRSPDEIEAEKKRELIDSINRVPFENEAADKGTAFNEIVDCLLHKRNKSENEKIKALVSNRENNSIDVHINNFHFSFDLSFCTEASKYFIGSTSQVYVSAILPTKYGDVELYGYADEIKKDVIYDIKTTSKYEFGKYEKKWQRHTYPYCLIESGMMNDVKAFEFTVYHLKGGSGRTPLIYGTQFPEYYAYNHENSKQLLTNHCEAFIEFLEVHKDSITDKKIFNRHEDA
jgi:hypothetical protein